MTPYFSTVVEGAALCTARESPDLRTASGRSQLTPRSHKSLPALLLLLLVVLTFAPGFLRPNSWCPLLSPEVEFPLVKAAVSLLALRAGKGSARCSGLCVMVLTFLLPRPECWDAPALEEQGRCP